MKEGELTNVYFKQELSYTGKRGNIKIGESIDPEKRGKSLETGNSNRLIEVACIPNVPPSFEYDLQERFAEERIWPKKEWFLPSKRILEYIAKVNYDQKHANATSFSLAKPIFFVAIIVIILLALKSCNSGEVIRPKPIVAPIPIKTKTHLLKPVTKTKPFAKIKRNINADSQRKNELEKIKVSQDKAKEERYQKSYVAYKRKFRTPTDITLVTLHCDGIAYRGYVRNISNDYVDILSNGFIISLEKNKLSRSSKAICYRNDYAKYMASNNYK